MATELKDSYNEIVFDKRNKKFGAYFIRRIYARTVLYAFGISVLVFSMALSSPVIYNKYFKPEEKVEDFQMVVADVMKVDDLPQEEEKVEEKPEPLAASIKFPPLEIRPDLEVPKEEEEIATQEELEESNPGTETHEGDPNISLNDPNSNPIQPPADPIVPQEEEAVAFVEQMPEFPGGDEALFSFMQSHLKYTNEAKSNNITGMVVIEFVVNKDGSLSDFKVVKSLGYGLDEAALTVLKSMPHWKAGAMNGEHKKVKRKLPFRFTLK